MTPSASDLHGHFLLTNMLAPLMVGTGRPSRIVNVASAPHLFGTVDFGDLQSRRGYDPWRAYGQSKLAKEARSLWCEQHSRVEE